jgi:predicted nucleic acid-binding protein
VTETQGAEILAELKGAPLVVFPSALLAREALVVAVETGRTFYDSIYVALAYTQDRVLVTADRRLYNALRGGPLAPHVVWVEERL